ncbi:iron ABC transporter permease [Clostridiaceae bacterium HFYG-1003]|nr:iron ABC transporter permease [Clostridiaceae bacterium HFYG-1003]
MVSSTPSRRIDRWFDPTLRVILIAGILLFILYPIGSVIATSFYYRGTFTLQNYMDLADPRNVTLILNSLRIGIVSSGIAVLIALAISLFAFGQAAVVKKRIETLLMVTMISPPFVSALAYIILFGRRGLITHGWLGLSINPYGWHGIVILQVLGSISFATLMVLNSLSSIDLRHLLAAQDLGARPGAILRTVVLPLLRPTLLSVFFLLFTMNIADFGTPIVIGGNFKVLATEAYLQVISTPHLGKAAAISVLMLPSAIVAFYFYQKSFSRTDLTSVGVTSLKNDDYRFPLPKPLSIFLGSLVGLYFFIMLLKYGNIFLSTVANTSTGRIVLTDQYFKDLPLTFFKSFRASIALSALAGLIAPLLGILLSYYVHRRRLNYLKPVEFIASLPFIIPGTFYGLGYVAAFSHQPLMLRGTWLILGANMVFRQISVSNKAANSFFVTLDHRLEHAASDLGASKFRILGNVILPLTRPIFYTSFISVFTSSMTSMGAIAFIVSPGMNLASMELFGSVENGRYGVASVQAVMMIAVIALVNVIVLAIKNRKRVT